MKLWRHFLENINTVFQIQLLSKVTFCSEALLPHSILVLSHFVHLPRHQPEKRLKNCENVFFKLPLLTSNPVVNDDCVFSAKKILLFVKQLMLRQGVLLG